MVYTEHPGLLVYFGDTHPDLWFGLDEVELVEDKGEEVVEVQIEESAVEFTHFGEKFFAKMTPGSRAKIENGVLMVSGPKDVTIQCSYCAYDAVYFVEGTPMCKGCAMKAI